MVIPYLSLLKIRLIKECNDLEYDGNGKLSEFVEGKYNRLKTLYSVLDDSILIRIIISSFKDDKLVEEFAMSVPKSYELFRKEVDIYDKEKFPFLCAEKDAGPSYNISQYLKYIKPSNEPEPAKKSAKTLSTSLSDRLNLSKNWFN